MSVIVYMNITCEMYLTLSTSLTLMSYFYYSICADMPAAWLERSMDTMKLMQSRNISKKVKIPQKSLTEKFTYISFEENDFGGDSASDFDFDHITRDHNLDASTLNESKSNSPKLTKLPSEFWPQTSPHVMRDEIEESKISNLKTRLKSSPFGDTSQIYEHNDRLRKSAKISQEKLRRGESRLLKKTHPDKVLRTTQRKKLYPSQLLHQQQQQQQEEEAALSKRKSGRTSKSRLHDSYDYSGPVEVPADTVQSKVVAEKLFTSPTSTSTHTSSSRPTSSDPNTVGTTTATATATASLDHLSYAERLQVMIMHCQDSMPVDEE